MEGYEGLGNIGKDLDIFSNIDMTFVKDTKRVVESSGIIQVSERMRSIVPEYFKEVKIIPTEVLEVLRDKSEIMEVVRSGLTPALSTVKIIQGLGIEEITEKCVYGNIDRR